MSTNVTKEERVESPPSRVWRGFLSDRDQNREEFPDTNDSPEGLLGEREIRPLCPVWTLIHVESFVVDVSLHEKKGRLFLKRAEKFPKRTIGELDRTSSSLTGILLLLFYGPTRVKKSETL